MLKRNRFIGKVIYLHRNVWNPGPLPENVEPSLSSAGSLPNDSNESNNSSSIRRYVSFTDERVEMNKSVQWTILQSPFTEYVTRRRTEIVETFRCGMVQFDNLGAVRDRRSSYQCGPECYGHTRNGA